MKSATIFLSAAALATAALAQPHRHHNHARHHRAHMRDSVKEDAAVQKRALVTNWVTEWVTETVTEYYDVTETKTINTATESSASSTSTTVAAQFFEPASSRPPVAPPVPSPAPVEVKPAPSPSPSQAAPPPPPPPPPPPAPEKTSVAPPPVQSTPPPAPVVQAPPPPPAPSPSSSGSKSGSSSGGGGGGGGGSSFNGEVTHYTVGMGACGIDDGGKDRSDYIVALSHTLMTGPGYPDAQCGKKVTLSYNGKSVTAVVHDKCPSCGPDQIDVSEKTFLDLFGDLGIGRAHGVSWTLG